MYVKHYSVTGLFERLRATPAATPTRWTSATGPGRSCWPCSAWSTTAAGTASCICRPGTATCSTPTAIRSSKAGRRLAAQPGERLTPPLVADGVLFRVLQNLLILDGERISYRSLDVEQIGSVYETIMGFRLEKAAGRSIAIKPAKAHGAPVTINLEELLASRPARTAASG